MVRRRRRAGWAGLPFGVRAGAVEDAKEEAIEGFGETAGSLRHVLSGPAWRPIAAVELASERPIASRSTVAFLLLPQLREPIALACRKGRRAIAVEAP